MPQDQIIIQGAREHNLKGIDVKIPRNSLCVITGLSGSGKSSLAFDTIYAEGQRRYVESLSAYARQFLEQLKKPNVDHIEGLSPAVAIEQRSASSNPRSTVATTTEIYDYLRLLFARIGKPHCWQCGKPIAQQTVQEIVETILSFPKSARLQIMAPLVRGRKGEYQKVFQEARRAGFVRVRVDGQVHDLAHSIPLNKKLKHTIEIVVDRLVVEEGMKKRLADSVETALKVGKGVVVVSSDAAPEGGEGKRKGRAPHPPLSPSTGGEGKEDYIFSELYACVDCGVSFPELEPRIFSFNSPYGACPA